MKYALIGCGRISPFHLQSAIDTHLEIVGLCDKDLSHAVSLAKEYHLAHTHLYDNYLEMIEREKPTFVAVATESGSHYQIVMDILSMGVHVLVEKPMAMSLHDADQMIAKAQEMQVFLGVCQQNRLNDSTQLVKKALDCGAFGKLSHGSLAVRWSRAQDYYDQAPWRGKWESDGGTLMNQCIHGLDLLRWFMGSNVKSVTSHLANRFHPYLEVEDVGIGFVLFCDGSVATIEGTTNVYEDNLEESITLIGQKGSVVLGGQVADEIKYWHFENEEVDGWGKNLDVKPFSSVYGNGHVRIYSDFIDSIQNHHRPYVDGKDGRNALEMVLSMYESHRLGKSVNLPLQEASTSDMQGINLGFIS